MKLTILGAGTGASQLPNIKSLYPPGFLVEWEDQKILFECSEGVRFQLEKNGTNFSEISHVAISHPHPDHYELMQYLQALYLKGEWGGEQFKIPKLNIYCPKYIAVNFPKLWKLFWGEERGYFSWPELAFNSMPQQNNLSIGNAKLSAERVYHGSGKLDAVAFRLETAEGIFAYSGDTGICEGINEVSKNADIFVCEASSKIGDVAQATDWGHLNPRQAGEIAKASNVKKLILFHYTGLDTEEAMIADCQLSGFEGEVVIGKDFYAMEF